MTRKETKKAKSNVEQALGWLGRQIGDVGRAMKEGKAAKAAKARKTGAGSGAAGRQVVHRERRVQEAEMPERPGMVLRRTVIDEVIVEKSVVAGDESSGIGKDPGTGSTKKSK